jgi:hypothetical protein
MEARGVVPNRVTYNSVIEALAAAGEPIRAELVFMSGVRTGIYSLEDLQTSNPTGGGSSGGGHSPDKSTLTMDLHWYSVAVAKAAISHVLGEVLAGALPVAPLCLITGRGNHVNPGIAPGVLRAQVEAFLRQQGLSPERAAHNSGRLLVSGNAMVLWFERSSDGTDEKEGRSRHSSGSCGADDSHGGAGISSGRAGGGVHGPNLQVRIAQAKQTIDPDVRAVCPFSAKGEAMAAEKGMSTDGGVPVQELLRLEAAVPTDKSSSGRCPAHAHATTAVREKEEGEGEEERHAVVPTDKSSSGGCPAHAHATTAVEALVARQNEP